MQERKVPVLLLLIIGAPHRLTNIPEKVTVDIWTAFALFGA